MSVLFLVCPPTTISYADEPYGPNYPVANVLTLDDPCVLYNGYMIGKSWEKNFVIELDLGCVDWVSAVELRNTNNLHARDR